MVLTIVFYFYPPALEERQGHHLKLYQYCSSDIHDIVQRQLRVRSLSPSLSPFLRGTLDL